MYDLISKLSFTRGMNIILILFGLIVAPYWFLFQFAPQLHKTYDFPKLILLSAGIATPIYLITTWIIGAYVTRIIGFEDERPDYLFNLLATNSLIGGLSFYVPCIWNYIMPGITQHRAIEIVTIFNLSYMLPAVIILIRNMLYKKKKNIS